MKRRAEIRRETSETSIECRLDLDGTGQCNIKTGLGFLDHMISALAKHGGLDLDLVAGGDTHIDDHHTVEDCAIVLGRAINEALGDRAGITRFGSSYAPLDESLSRAVIDLSGRPWPEIHLSLTRDTIGDVAAENLTHFLRSLAVEARMALHVDVIRGDNDHHKAESAFKAAAIALRTAVTVIGDDIPSTKGSLV
ncbi:MAG: imidazoleglycerol-phosphate dehydratase HisB [Acidimicrobiia bacterium]